MARPKFDAGDAFAVPLRDSGYAVGVIARKTKDGGLFGYFFGPRRECVPGVETLSVLRPSEAVLVAIIGHLGLSRGSTANSGEWLIIGSMPDWDEADWPLPAFVLPDRLGGGTFLVTYDESNLLHELDRKHFPPSVQLDGPQDGLMGAGFVEIRLTRLLAELEA